jgi:6-phosphogluconolactonase
MNPCVQQSSAVSFERVVAPPVELARNFAGRLVVCARNVQAEGRRLSLVLPGGSVAETFFPMLAGTEFEWNAVELFWGDERAVPPNDPESNYWLAERLLLSRVQIDRARVHRMPADAADLELAARSYEAEIVRALGGPSRFDVVLLGVGPDGHVCSLFPGHPALDVTARRAVPVMDSPKPPPARLTLTLAALEGADLFVAAFGGAKASVVSEAFVNPDSPLPVARAARMARHATFLLDQQAAGNPAGIA